MNKAIALLLFCASYAWAGESAFPGNPSRFSISERGTEDTLRTACIEFLKLRCHFRFLGLNVNRFFLFSNCPGFCLKNSVLISFIYIKALALCM